MRRFPPPDPVAALLTARFGPEFGPGGRTGADLTPLRATLAALGDPQRALPPVVHIAGTNGKGSTAAFITTIAEAAGLRVHAFTQPHLVRVTERLRLAGAMAAEEQFLAAIESVVAAADPSLSHFEAQTAAVFLCATSTPADLLVLEVGCGGRFDATNVVPPPPVGVITPIGLDHMAVLGQTLPEIAGHKAGIIKTGMAVVVTPQAPEAEDVVFREAQTVGACVLLHGQDWQAWTERDRLLVQCEDRLFDLPQPGMIGAHQVINAGAAVMAVSALNDGRIREDALARGVAEARLAGRMQRLTSGPLAAAAERVGAELWVDGAHNPAGAEALAAALRTLQARRPAPRVALVLGLLSDKTPGALLAPLAAAVDAVVATSVIGPRACVPAEEIATAAEVVGVSIARLAPGLHAAIETAAGIAPGGRIVITGSLSLAGEALFCSELLA